MPSIFTHAIFTSIFWTFFKDKNNKNKVIFLCILGSIIPDLDVLGGYFGYNHFHHFGHRGITHSLFFAVGLGILFSCFFIGKVKSIKIFIVLFFVFFFSISSHGILDAFTSGGSGVCFFCPFSYKRYFFSYRPILVSPIGMNFFSGRGLLTIVSEMKLVWSIVGVYYLVYFLLKNKNN